MTFVYALIVFFIAACAAYFLLPGMVFKFALALARRASGLRLRQVQFDGHIVPYLEGGAGEPLVLLHGFAANKDNWTAVARFLTPHFRVIALDVPGFGDSTRDPAARYALDDQLARLSAFTRALGLDRFHLGGNSMGGYLAAMYAARHPQQVQTLWLLAPAGVRGAQPSELLQILDTGVNPLVVTDAAGLDRLIEMCFHTAPFMPAQFKRPLLARAVSEAPFNSRIFEQMFSDPLAFEDLPEPISTPALIVWGDSDRILHPSGLELLGGLCSQAETRMMPRMGHIPMMERPAEVAADLLRFHRR